MPLGQHRPRVLGEDPRHDGLRRGAGERRLAGEHLVEHAAQGVHVAAGGDLPLAHRLLGAHVVRGAERHAGFRHARPAGLAGGKRDAEVGHQGPAVVQQDVFGLDVAMDHVVAVRVVQRARHLGGDAHRVRHRELLFPVHPVADRFAFDVRHHVEEEPVGLPTVEEGEDMRVLEVGRGLDLAQEPLGADHGRELGPEHLDRHPAIVLEVLGQVDGGHAALAELALEAVAVGEGVGQAAGGMAHRIPWLLDGLLVRGRLGRIQGDHPHQRIERPGRQAVGGQHGLGRRRVRLDSQRHRDGAVHIPTSAGRGRLGGLLPLLAGDADEQRR